MRYNALFVIFEKKAKFEIVICNVLWVALYHIQNSFAALTLRNQTRFLLHVNRQPLTDDSHETPNLIFHENKDGYHKYGIFRPVLNLKQLTLTTPRKKKCI